MPESPSDWNILRRTVKVPSLPPPPLAVHASAAATRAFPTIDAALSIAAAPAGARLVVRVPPALDPEPEPKYGTALLGRTHSASPLLSTKVPHPLHLVTTSGRPGEAASPAVAEAKAVEAYEAAADGDGDGDACCLTLTTSSGVTARAVTMEPMDPEIRRGRSTDDDEDEDGNDDSTCSADDDDEDCFGAAAPEVAMMGALLPVRVGVDTATAVSAE
mmetsp:Transcript_23907/g.51739  ORF Transcript_23907/g.51739 Transcript_23907/m.51739 type:complete len:217 (-) Transcript_23907:99-749(-)